MNKLNDFLNVLKAFEMKLYHLTTILFVITLGCSQPQAPEPSVVPLPNEISRSAGSFTLRVNESISISHSTLSNEAMLLKGWIKAKTIDSINQATIHLSIDPGIEDGEGYVLNITSSGIRISGGTPAGVFYGLQSLRQMLPISIETDEFENVVLPLVSIKDQPRFKWRGMHLDVSRHFMPAEFVKKYIDYIAMHKMNVFHWHLVDGIGWRIEIRKYPELTDWGAWRIVKGDKPWIDFEIWKPGDDRQREGGYYTQEEIREIVAYAASRHVTVVPEIELPGHSKVVFQCYPDLMCEGREKPLQNIGVYCAGNPQSFTFLEDILEEVLDLFPGEYIHIGGDEVNKKNWKECPKCAGTMQTHDLKDTYELQSYFVNHFDRFLTQRGRKLIGWHEILEGELTPSATIMYWGGANRVPDYLREGHNTVLSPGSHLYFDHYQSLSDNEPRAWGGFSDLTKVYHYEPIPEDLEQEFTNLIMGVQANVWTEYMKTPEHVEYMVIPRMTALSEVAWSRGDQKDWGSFKERLVKLIPRFAALDVNVSRSAYLPKIEVKLDSGSNTPYLFFETELDARIHYTLDGSDPTISSTLYDDNPIPLEKTELVKAIAEVDGKILSPVEQKTAVVHKGRGATVELISQPYDKYFAKGGGTLADLEFGGNKWGNGKWLGILDKDFEAILEFDTSQKINNIGFSCIEDNGAGIYLPVTIEISGSDDNKNFELVGNWSQEQPEQKSTEVKAYTFNIPGNVKSYRFLKVKARSLATTANRSGVFLFIDEIIVE